MLNRRRFKKVIGIFDLKLTAGTLGNLLILIEELAIKIQEYGPDIVDADILILRDTNQLISNDFNLGNSGTFDTSILQSVSEAIGFISACHDATQANFSELQDLLVGNILWPSPQSILSYGHNYDSTKRIQAYHKNVGSIPKLFVKPALLAYTKQYIADKAAGALAVAIHLKQNPLAIGQSNANISSWHTFFQKVTKRYHVHFFLMGDETSNAIFKSLPNVSILRDDDLSIAYQLALIQACPLFMGMMSGPSNMAIFGENSYVLFKNPNHHYNEMQIEIGLSNQYPFAIGHQKILRIFDTSDNITNAFELALQHIT